MFLKAGGITNLTDARYFSAWGVKWIGFAAGRENDRLGSISLNAMAEWLEGSQIVAEFISLDRAIISEYWENINVSGIQVAEAHSLPSNEATVFLEYTMNGLDRIDELKHFLTQNQDRADYTVLVLAGEWNTHSRHEKFDDLIALSQQFPVIFQLSYQAGQYPQFIKKVNPIGLQFQGSEEEKVGFKSFEELNDIRDILEDYVSDLM